MRVERFTIEVEEQALDGLRERARATRWPDQLADIEWKQGTELRYLRELVGYWADEFDWRAEERELNRLNHFRAQIDGRWIHFVHERGVGDAPIPLILTHGWPSTFLELLTVVPLLTDPAAHGIEGPSFDVVIPSLPGYGFSDRPRRTGRTTPAVAADWNALMHGLGYDRYGAGGSDFGSAVTTFLGRDHAASVLAIHLTTLDVAPYVGEGSRPLSAAEAAFVERGDAWWEQERGYKELQATKPQTAAYGLHDSPAALAAWLIEKWRSWSDCAGDVDQRFGRDFLLATLTTYWVTETAASSLRTYYDDRRLEPIGPDEFVDVPTAVAVFAHQLFPEGEPPREWAERLYDVRRWTVMPRGGHFAAREEPELVAADIASFFGELIKPEGEPQRD